MLISVNPYKRMADVGPEISKKYMGRSQHDVPPHIYAVADNMYRRCVGVALTRLADALRLFVDTHISALVSRGDDYASTTRTACVNQAFAHNIGTSVCSFHAATVG